MGLTVCTGGNATCIETTKLRANGSPCGNGAVCLNGECSPCDEGSECSLENNPCFAGGIVCATGRPVCVESAHMPDGTACGPAMVCRTGACVACQAGDPCTPTANSCHEGTLVCAGGSASCQDTNRSKPAGSPCGPSSVCSATGTCLECRAGMACDLLNEACQTGKIDCSGGSPQCVASGNEANGKVCGNGRVCREGACETCADGMTCRPANACHVGRLSCATGTAICTDTGANVANGAMCGTNLFCSNGNCLACTPGSTCSPDNPCKTGGTSCETGTSQCLESGNQRDGTSCGEGRVCQNGICRACGDGMPCTPANKCHRGQLSCATGRPVCMDIGSNVMNGTACGTNLSCSNGLCVPNCVPGTQACGTNNQCTTGRNRCPSGCQQTPEPDGKNCGTCRECRGGSCQPKLCAQGQVCNPNTGACEEDCGDRGEPCCLDFRCNAPNLSCAFQNGNNIPLPADEAGGLRPLRCLPCGRIDNGGLCCGANLNSERDFDEVKLPRVDRCTQPGTVCYEGPDLSSCGPCGEPGGECCLRGEPCTGTTCGPNDFGDANVCLCGLLGQPCCFSDICSEGACKFGPDGQRCVSCGKLGQPCCRLRTCSEGRCAGPDADTCV
jgi:hypothetical protein